MLRGCCRTEVGIAAGILVRSTGEKPVVTIFV